VPSDVLMWISCPAFARQSRMTEVSTASENLDINLHSQDCNWENITVCSRHRRCTSVYGGRG